MILLSPFHKSYLTKSYALLAVHSLNDCDTTSKVLTKQAAIKTVTKDYYHILTEFGKSDMNNRITSNAEEYLLHFLSNGVSNNENFKDLLYTMYHQETTRWTLRNYHTYPVLFTFTFYVHTCNVFFDYTLHFRI